MWRSRINSEEKSQEGKRMKIESGGIKGEVKGKERK